MHTVHVYLLYICAYNLHMRIYMYERDTGCTLMRLNHTDYFLCQAANWFCLLILSFIFQMRPKVKWLRGFISTVLYKIFYVIDLQRVVHNCEVEGKEFPFLLPLKCEKCGVHLFFSPFYADMYKLNRAEKIPFQDQSLFHLCEIQYESNSFM